MMPFLLFVYGHILTGATGLVQVWIPGLTRKGAQAHRVWGRRFALAMLATGSLAVAMATCTLRNPLGTHPHQTDPRFVSGIFGWMMIYLALLTISLAWHGVTVVTNAKDRTANRRPFAVGLQVLVIVAAVNCAVQGALIGQILMMLIAMIGIASGVTNLVFSFKPRPTPGDHVLEHIKASVGAGISVYTAFLAFGAVRLIPEHVFNPVLWSMPTLVGVSLILYFQRRFSRPRSRYAPSPKRPVRPGPRDPVVLHGPDGPTGQNPPPFRAE